MLLTVDARRDTNWAVEERMKEDVGMRGRGSPDIGKEAKKGEDRGTKDLPGMKRKGGN